jgi:hypothetical protein
MMMRVGRQVQAAQHFFQHSRPYFSPSPCPQKRSHKHNKDKAPRFRTALGAPHTATTQALGEQATRPDAPSEPSSEAFKTKIQETNPQEEQTRVVLHIAHAVARAAGAETVQFDRCST